MKSTNALFKLSIVQIAEGVPVSGLDEIVQTIETQAREVDANALFVFAGKQSQLLSDASPQNQAVIVD